MRKVVFLLIFFLYQTLSAQERYFFVENQEEAAGYEKAVKSGDYLEIDFETGLFTGMYQAQKFSGVWDLQVRAAGFVKGFNYSVDLGYLQRNIPLKSSPYEVLTDRLARANRFFVYPDNLASPTWDFIEIYSEAFNGKLLLVKSH